MNMRNNRARSTIVFFIAVSCFAIIVGNIFVIQIMHRSFFAELGSHQYTVPLNQLPPRGSIIDRTGSAYLATNTACISAFIIPKQIKRASNLEPFLADHFPQAYRRLKHNPKSSFLYIKRRLTPEEQELIMLSDCSDIHLLEESSRFYPMPSAAPLVGFTDIDNVGRAGLELCFNEQLTGTPEKGTLEKDARSGYFYFSKQLQDAGTNSVSLYVTIDSSLQFLVDEALAQACERCHATEAHAIVMNPDNGDILALSSYPATHIDDPHFTFYYTKQRAVTEQYELGSVMKVFAALAALEEQVVAPDTIIDCKNCTECTIDDRPITTWKAHGNLPFCDVIAFSNNIGMAQVAKLLGPKIVDHYQRLGFGTKTGIALPAEASGFINPPKQWSRQSIISLSYGYEISATLLQLAQAFSLIAHNGHFVTPRLVLSDPIQVSDTRCYSEESISTIRDILRKTTAYGTGRRARLAGFDVMTKTGSANTLVNGVYHHDKNIYTAAAIIEKGTYKRVIVTSVREATMQNAFAATIAMPLLRRIAEKMVIHERVV